MALRVSGTPEWIVSLWLSIPSPVSYQRPGLHVRYVCMYVCMYVCAYVRVYICTFVRMYLCVCVCTYMYMKEYLIQHILGIMNTILKCTHIQLQRESSFFFFLFLLPLTKPIILSNKCFVAKEGACDPERLSEAKFLGQGRTVFNTRCGCNTQWGRSTQRGRKYAVGSQVCGGAEGTQWGRRNAVGPQARNWAAGTQWDCTYAGPRILTIYVHVYVYIYIYINIIYI